MKLSEVKKSIVVALMKSVTTKNEKKAINVSKDVERQIEIVGKFLENKFGFSSFHLSKPSKYIFSNGSLSSLKEKPLSTLSWGIHIPKPGSL